MTVYETIELIRHYFGCSFINNKIKRTEKELYTLTQLGPQSLIPCTETCSIRMSEQSVLQKLLK